MNGKNKLLEIPVNGIVVAKQLPSLIKEMYSIMPQINIELTGTSFHKNLLINELSFNNIEVKFGNSRFNKYDASIHLFYNSAPIYRDGILRFHCDPLKFESRTLLNNNEIDSLRDKYKIKKSETVVLAGALHEIEVDIIGPILKKYLENNVKSKLVVVPYTEGSLSKLVEYFSLETDACNIKGDKNCLVIEQQGILDSLYSMADIVLIGNTFHHGSYDGQNPLEPAFYNKRILSGCDYHKWNKIAYDGLKQSGLLKKVSFSDLYSELTREVSRQESETTQKLANEFIASQQGAAKVYANIVRQSLYNKLSNEDKDYLSQEQQFDVLKEKYLISK